MPLPGFTAESSFRDNASHYRSWSRGGPGLAHTRSILPAEAIHGVSCQVTCFDCGPFGLFSCCTRPICGIGDIELPVVG